MDFSRDFTERDRPGGAYGAARRRFSRPRLARGRVVAIAAELERVCVSGACPPQEHDALDGLRRLSHASTGLLVAGGVLGAAGGLWWTVAAVKRGGSQGSSALSAPLKVRVGLAGLDVRMRF